jgi:probable HAF family extracellular repeat protein
MADLGTLGGAESRAFGINDMGQVVGDADTDDGQRHAFITGPDGVGITDLGTLGGAVSYAEGINDAGQVVGLSFIANGQFHAFITGPDGVGMTDLASVVNAPTGFYFSDATAINNHGQLVTNALPVVPAIPEPEIYAMLLAGLGLLGSIARRRATA